MKVEHNDSIAKELGNNLQVEQHAGQMQSILRAEAVEFLRRLIRFVEK